MQDSQIKQLVHRMIRPASYNLNDCKILEKFLKYSSKVFQMESLFLIKFLRIYLSIANPGLLDLNNLKSNNKKDRRSAQLKMNQFKQK